MAKSPILQATSSKAKRKLVFLFGPTGVGKTELLLSLDPSRYAVVNADSIQVYRGLDIGSAKASPELRRTFKHYLIDIEDPSEQFSVGTFLHLADEACDEIIREGKTPIISGGTAYYFKHFLYGLPSAPPSDAKVRERIALEVQEHGLDWAYRKLASVDPESGRRIQKQDAYRITRALEVFEQSGKPLSTFCLPDTPRNGMEPLIIGLTREKELLEQRINDRVERMFQEGLVEEVRGLVKQGALASWPGMQGIGYREFFAAMTEGEEGIPLIKAEIKRNSRLYAKRQMTFFRTFPSVTWLDPEDRSAFARRVDSFVCSSDR
jgi:tRNA dimethylallyltransferase